MEQKAIAWVKTVTAVKLTTNKQTMAIVSIVKTSSKESKHNYCKVALLS